MSTVLKTALYRQVRHIRHLRHLMVFWYMNDRCPTNDRIWYGEFERKLIIEENRQMTVAKVPGRGPGRPLGARNKSTAAVKEVAQQFTESAISVLAAIMVDPLAPHAARVAAAGQLLDRGHGRPHQTQDLTVTEDRKWSLRRKLLPRNGMRFALGCARHQRNCRTRH
jgi:hypothetical protein